MTDQPSGQPPHQPAHQPQTPSAAGLPTQPLSSAQNAALSGPAAPPVAPQPSVWRQATATPGRRWGLAIGAGLLALSMLVGVLGVGLLVLRNHDRVGFMGGRDEGFARGQDDRGFGQRGGDGDWSHPGMPGKPGDRDQGPGMPGGRVPGLEGFGNLLGGSALHGAVTATVNGSLQSLVFQRGAVTAVSATSITLKSSDGFAGTYRLTTVTTSRGAAPVKGGQVFVLARAADKVALMTVSTNVGVDPAPSS